MKSRRAKKRLSNYFQGKHKKMNYLEEDEILMEGFKIHFPKKYEHSLEHVASSYNYEQIDDLKYGNDTQEIEIVPESIDQYAITQNPSKSDLVYILMI